MKKISYFLLASLVLLPLFTHADGFKTITLSPGWNVVSTPGILSSITYSNGGGGLSFFRLVGGRWQSVAGNTTNLRPTYGFLVNNNNSDNVIMSLRYSPQTVMGATFTDNVTAGWNLLGITNNNSLSAVGGEITVDFTNNGTTNLLNKVNDNYTTRYSNGVYNPEIGEAYGVYVRNGKEYGWVNNPVGDPISCKTNYSTKQVTNQNVVVTLTECTGGETILNGDSYTFTENGDHVFEYRDVYGNEGTYKVTVDWIERDAPVCNTITYSPSTPTNYNVTATLADCNETIYGEKYHTFTENGEYTLEYRDSAGNINHKTAVVNWIDKTAPTCEISYSPSTPTDGAVIVQFICNEEVQSSSFEFTGNISNRWTSVRDVAGNSTGAYITINRIQSHATIETDDSYYLNTSVPAGNTVRILAGILSGENKYGQAKYSLPSTYKLHIRNAQPWTPLKELVTNLKFTIVNVGGGNCIRESNNYIETDQNGNADVDINFDCSNQSAFVLSAPMNLNILIAIPSTAPQGVRYYVDDIDANNLTFTNGLYIIDSGEIQSRTITVGNPNLNLSSNELIKSVKRGDYILIYDGEISTTANEARISNINIYSNETFNNKLDLKLYIGDELIGEETQERDYYPDIPNMGITEFGGATIYPGQNKNIKLYGKIYESIPVGTYFKPIVRIDSARDENDLSFKELPTITGHSFLVYDIFRLLDIQKTDDITTSSFGSETRNRLIFKGVLSSSSEDDIKISSLKLTNDNDTFNGYIRLHFYIDGELIGEGLLQNGVFSVNTNYNINRNKAYLFEIYADTVCQVPNPATLNQTISIGAATQGGNSIPNDRLPSVQGGTFTMGTNLWNYGCTGLWND